MSCLEIGDFDCLVQALQNLAELVDQFHLQRFGQFLVVLMGGNERTAGIDDDIAGIFKKKKLESN